MSGRAGDDDVLVLPPLPADPLFVDAVEDAVAGGTDDLPNAQPQRRIGADPREFASLYMRHRTSFGLHARRFLYDARDVEEVLQEAFLRLFLAMPELETELQALAYCRRTVTNLCIDRYRADQRRPRLVDLDTIEWDPRDEASYDDPVLRAEDAAIVRQALALLTPMHRAALVKREIEEKPLPVIAEELGIPEDSVKHLLYRARRALRRLLVGTSVEPGADLTNSQLVRLANERLARATLRSANVLIVLFVTAVTVVGALRVGANDQETRSGGEVGAVMTPQARGAQDNPAHRLSPPHTRPLKAAVARNPHRASESGSTQDAAPMPHVAVAHKETFTSKAPRDVGPRSSRPKNSPVYSLRGSLRPTGPVRVQPLTRVIDPANGTTATSVLTAPTEQGAFSLTQVISQSVDGTASVTVQPQLVNAGSVVTAGVASSAALTRDPSGAVSVDVVATNASSVPSPIGDLRVHLLLDGDLVHVLSETVTVGPVATSSQASAPAVTPPTVTGTVTCSSGPTTSETSNVATASPTGTVIGMSPKGLDDQQGQCSSFTNGGGVPLLPSPAQP